MDTHTFSDLINLRDDNGDRIGMFKWAWMFNNAVNTRIEKNNIEWETAVEMFYNETEVCSTNCAAIVDNNNTDNTDNTNNNNTDNTDNTDTNNNNNSTTDTTVTDLPTDTPDRKSKLAQGYFMSIGIPNTLKKNGIVDITNQTQTKAYHNNYSEVSFITFS